MAGFDTTNVAATVGQNNAPNPIDTVQKFAFIQNLMNQNRLFQAQRAVGQAVQGAVDPTTGIFSPNAANTAIAGNPMAAPAAMDALTSTQAYSTSAQALAAQRYGAVQKVIGPLMTAPGITNSDVEGSLALLKNSGVVPPAMVDDIAGHLPIDPTQLRPYLATRFGLPNLGAEQALAATAPPPAMTDIGGQITPVTPPAQIGTGTLAGPAGPGGVPQIQPNTAAPGVAPGVVKTLPPQVANTPAYQRYNPQTRQMETVTQAQAAAAPPGGPVGAGPPLGTPEAVATAATANTQQAMAMQAAANEVPTRKALLSNLQILAPQFAAGPQSPFWKSVGSVAAEYGIPVPNANLATNATAAQEEFDKLSVQVLGSQRVAAGLPQTDASTALASGATPNERMTPKGIQRVLGVMQGNEDYIAAQNSAYQKWLSAGNTGETFGQFKNQFNRMFDPRVFQAQYATPDEKALIVKSVGPQTFEKQWTALHRLGWLGAPSGQ